jgi:retron-type reverse transcriptase
MLTPTVQKQMDRLPAIALAGRPVNGLTRLMASPSLWLNAVERIRRNDGSLTPGVDGKTLDGLTVEQVYRWMQQVRDGSKTASPVKRVYIPKPNGKRRPLGIPTYADRMLQEVQRTILERVYEPLFSQDSHGFRPGRSCHTALETVRRFWTGTK